MQDVNQRPPESLPTIKERETVVGYYESLLRLDSIGGTIVPFDDDQARIYGQLYKALRHKFRIDISSILTISNNIDSARWATSYHSLRVMAMAKSMRAIVETIKNPSLQGMDFIEKDHPNYPLQSFIVLNGVNPLASSTWDNKCPGPVLSPWYFTGAGSISQTPNGFNVDAYCQYMSSASMELHRTCMSILSQRNINHDDVLLILSSEPTLFEHACLLIQYCHQHKSLLSFPDNNCDWMKPYLDKKIGEGHNWILSWARSAAPTSVECFEHYENGNQQNYVFEPLHPDKYNRFFVHAHMGSIMRRWVLMAFEFYMEQFGTTCIKNENEWYDLDEANIPEKMMNPRQDLTDDFFPDVFDNIIFDNHIDNHINNQNNNNNHNDGEKEEDFSLLLDNF